MLTSVSHPSALGEDSLAVDAAFQFIFVDWIIGTVVAVVLGVLIGAYFRRFWSRWKALLILLLAIFVPVALAYWGDDQFAHIPDAVGRDVLTYLIVFYTAIVLSSCSLGKRLRRRFGRADPRPKLDPVEELVISIVLSANTPETADMPWTVKRWNVMSDEEKRAWVETHMVAINRYFEEDGDGKGISDKGFIAELQRIDNSAGKPTTSSRPRPLREI